MDGLRLDFNCPVGPENFKAVEGGNFCQLCEKKVFDLRGLSDSEIGALQTDHPKGICGTVRLNQLSNAPEEKLVLGMGRPLKPWEVWLLAMVMCFGLPFSALGQTSSGALTEEQGIATIGEEIDVFLQSFSENCESRYYQGIILYPPPPKLLMDTVVLKDDHDNRGIEIIVLRPFLTFEENSADDYRNTTVKKVIGEGLMNLIQSADSISDFPWKTIHIHGHADIHETGDLQDLSKRRAESVAAWLAQWGFPNEVKVKGFGATKPYDGTEGPAPYRNRRVEIIMAEDWNY